MKLVIVDKWGEFSRLDNSGRGTTTNERIKELDATNIRIISGTYDGDLIVEMKDGSEWYASELWFKDAAEPHPLAKDHADDCAKHQHPGSHCTCGLTDRLKAEEQESVRNQWREHLKSCNQCQMNDPFPLCDQGQKILNRTTHKLAQNLST